MAAVLRLKNAFQKLKSAFSHKNQSLCHPVLEERSQAEVAAQLAPKSMAAALGDVDPSKWRKMNSRTFGMSLAMIPYASRIVVRILHSEGHDAYLVGGCVRDLLLNKIPKDFDVITTANLQEIKKIFNRAFIVGRRFPICRVHIRGSEIEVSSFETVASHEEGKEKVHLPGIPEGCDEKDVLRWKNSLHRDFTVNSMFYDPFAHKIYDYSNGMADLKAMKIRTLVPAYSSFQEDCARILRGIRIAARLGFTFAEDTEIAVHNLHASVKTLDKARLMMEMNYMLSYGAAQSSLLLLKKFNLLEILLPFQAAYLVDHSAEQTPIMLMKLFSNLDSVVSCDQPCDSVMWVSLLVFHLALVNNPQDALVVWTFSSLLYYGAWKEGVKAARQLSKEHVSFAPEIFNSFDDVAEEELARRVSQFASIVLDSIDALTDPKALHKIMDRYPSSPCADAVFISKNAGREAAEVYDVLLEDIKSRKERRQCYGIDYELLGKGNVMETRFVLGKVIMDTMKGGITQYRTKLLSEKKDVLNASKVKVEQVELGRPNTKDHKHEIQNCKGREKRRSDVPDVLGQQRAKKQKQNKKTSAVEEKLVKERMGEMLSKNEQQVKKVVAKDVNKLHSLQKETTQENAKLLKRQQCKAQTQKEKPTMVNKVPTMVKQHQALAPGEIMRVLEKVPSTGNQKNAQAPEWMLTKFGNIRNKSKQQRTQASVEMLDVLNLSNILKGDEDPIKKHSKPEKQPTMGEQGPDESNKKNRTQKLSSLFK